MAGNIDSTDLLMIGKTGNGKSALGNAILQKKAFKSKNSLESVTKTADFDYCQFDGRILKVVDGPGLGDTSLDPKEAVKLVVDAMSEAICTNPTGYHAILLVVRYGGRFTKEDTETVATLQKIFGEKFITDHAILVMTCGDSFKNDAEESGQTFEEWCAEQGGFFSQLYTDVQKRAILFDNATKEKDVMYDQMRQLLDLVDALGARYTPKIFAKAKRARYCLTQGTRCLVSEEAIRESGVITQLLGRVDYSKPAEGLQQLQDLKKRADLLLEDILEQDQGTNSLSAARKMAQNLKTTIADQLDEMQRVFDEMQQEDSEEGERPETECEESLEEENIPSEMTWPPQGEESLTEDECQNATMWQSQQANSDERGRLEVGCEKNSSKHMRRSAWIRQTETETFQTTEKKLGTLRLNKERMIKEMPEAEERERQRAENKKRRTEEKRTEETARKKDQMDIKKHQHEAEKMTEEKKKAIEHFKISMAQLEAEREKGLHKKVARMEDEYHELKEESRSAWMKAAPAVFSMIWSRFGIGEI